MPLVRKEAIKRAEIIDAEMGWESGCAIGKLTYLWASAQEDEGFNVVRGRQILEWARVKPEDAERFLELCCKVAASQDDDHIHFLEPRDNGRYFIVGNPDEVEHLARIRNARSNAGKASAEARKAKTGSAVPAGASNRCSEQTEQNSEHDAEQTHNKDATNPEQNGEQKPNASALASALAFESASASPLTPLMGGESSGSAEPPPLKPPGERKLRAMAKAAAVDVERELYNGADDYAAHEAIAPFARHLVRLTFGGRDFTDGWGKLGRRAQRAQHEKSEQPFLHGLRRDFAAKAEEAWIATFMSGTGSEHEMEVGE